MASKSKLFLTPHDRGKGKERDELDGWLSKKEPEDRERVVMRREM